MDMFQRIQGIVPERSCHQMVACIDHEHTHNSKCSMTVQVKYYEVPEAELEGLRTAFAAGTLQIKVEETELRMHDYNTFTASIASEVRPCHCPRNNPLYTDVHSNNFQVINRLLMNEKKFWSRWKNSRQSSRWQWRRKLC